MKKILTITAILFSVNISAQNPLKGMSDTTVMLRNYIRNYDSATSANYKTEPLTLSHISGGMRNAVIYPSDWQNRFIIKSKPPYTDFEVNGDRKEPILFKINDTEYLIFNKKIYRLLK